MIRPSRALKTSILLAALVAAAIAPGSAAGRQYAVVVGIDNYQSPDITSLRYAVRDARAFGETLLSLGFDRVFMLTDDQPNSESYPIRTNIIFRLEWLKERVGPDDSVVFYFAGHGIDVDGKVFLLTKESDPRSVGTLTESACSAARVRELLETMKARHLLVVYDACRSSPQAGRGVDDNRLSSRAARDLVLTRPPAAGDGLHRVAVTLFACSQNQRSYEWHQKQHGFFTYHLIQGLRGAAGEGGRVTLQSLLQYVSSAVPRSADEAGYRQQPWAETSGTSLSSWVLSEKASLSPTHSQPPVVRWNVTGRWVGPWGNSRGQRGESTLNLVEDSDRNVSGDWDGTPIRNVRRDGNVVRWNWTWKRATYEAVFTMKDDRTGRVEYTVQDPDQAPHEFTGWQDVRRR